MRIIEVLKKTSEYRHHKNNLAKEYVLTESGEFLTLGKNCYILENKLLIKSYISEDNYIRTEIVKEKYILLYGISLTNVISILYNKRIDIIGINTFKSDMGHRDYIITLKREHSYVFESYLFEEKASIEDFEKTSLGDFICDLYDVK